MTGDSDQVELRWPGKSADAVEPALGACPGLVEVPGLGHTGADAQADNRLIEADNVGVLPGLRTELAGAVRCAYIDPPFNTGGKFEQYADARSHAHWLSELRVCAQGLLHLLAEDGSLWLHLDDREVHYAKVVLDEVFGRRNFVASVVWQKVFARKNKALVSGSHDTILVYARDISRWRRNLMPRTSSQLRAYKNPDEDPRGPWQSVSYSVQSEDAQRRSAYRYPIAKPAGGVAHPPPGRHWNGLPERTAELRGENRLWFGPAGDRSPRIKVFAAHVQAGIVPDSWWSHTDCGHNQDAKKELLALFPEVEPFATPKPERLVHRILSIATDPGDLVLDAFAGSGTTGAVAHKMRRNWVMIERGRHCETLVRARMQRVVLGSDPGGVTSVTGWTGGGGFRYFRREP